MGSAITTVLALLLAAAPIVTASCDVTKLSSLHIDQARLPELIDKWYMVRATALPLLKGDLTALKVTIMAPEGMPGIQNSNLIRALMQEQLQGAYCWFDEHRCQVSGKTCTAINSIRTDTVVATDYSSVLAVWTEQTVFGIQDSMLSILVRDPTSPVDLSPISSQLGHFCGDTATDPSSDFYVLKPSYDNFQCDVSVSK